jgi:hypothetical protein
MKRWHHSEMVCAIVFGEMSFIQTFCHYCIYTYLLLAEAEFMRICYTRRKQWLAELIMGPPTSAYNTVVIQLPTHWTHVCVSNHWKAYCPITITWSLGSNHRDTLVEKGSRLWYIYGLCTCMELKPLPVAPLLLKFGIYLGQTGRKGVKGERKRDGVGGGGRKLQ